MWLISWCTPQCILRHECVEDIYQWTESCLPDGERSVHHHMAGFLTADMWWPSVGHSIVYSNITQSRTLDSRKSEALNYNYFVSCWKIQLLTLHISPLLSHYPIRPGTQLQQILTLVDRGLTTELCRHTLVQRWPKQDPCACQRTIVKRICKQKAASYSARQVSCLI